METKLDEIISKIDEFEEIIEATPPKIESEQKAPVKISKDELLKAIDHFAEKIHKIEVMLPDNRVAAFSVKTASLEDHIQSTSIVDAGLALIEKEHNFTAKSLFEISIFTRCVITPVYAIAEVAQMALVYPNVVNEVVTAILGLTPNFKIKK